jgi:hypothetical protein
MHSAWRGRRERTQEQETELKLRGKGEAHRIDWMESKERNSRARDRMGSRYHWNSQIRDRMSCCISPKRAQGARAREAQEKEKNMIL